jgi:hypothetical protein
MWQPSRNWRNRSRLDQRSGPVKEFDALVTAIETDLGGRDQLSAIERALVEAFASATMVLNHLSTKMLAGEKIEMTEHGAAVGAMVRVAARLGIGRRAGMLARHRCPGISLTWASSPSKPSKEAPNDAPPAS